MPTSELILRPKEVIFVSFGEEYFWQCIFCRGQYFLQGRVSFTGESIFSRREYFGEGKGSIFQFESQGDYSAGHVLHVGSLDIKVGIH